MKKIAVTAAVFLLAAVCSVGAVMLVQPEALSVRPITETSPCPVVGCASGSCHGFDDVPEPDGVHEKLPAHRWSAMVGKLSARATTRHRMRA